MWQSSHEAVVPNLDRRAVWNAWADVNHWPAWDADLESARLEDGFRTGEYFTIRPRGGPNVRIRIERAEPLVGFTDLTVFPLARMYGIHDMSETPEGLRLKTTVRIEGPLAWLWRRLVAQKIADGAAEQMAGLVAYVRNRTQ